MATSSRARGVKRATFWIAVAGTGVLGNVALGLAADHLPNFKGLQTFYAYVTRRNG